jgi:hypothetical protein
VLSAHLDRLARLELHVAGKRLPAFQVCGTAGLCLAIAASSALVARRGLSPWILAAIAVAAVSTFLSLAMLTKIVTGAETLVYYHHEIAVISVAAVLLSVLHRPVLPYLDVTALGLGLFLACGRIGCFMVGCCHGRPHGWGVRYVTEHADAGFTACYVGVRLLPVQLFESLWVLAVTSVGIVLVWNGALPGEAFTWYVAMYCVGRFGLEFLRGDAERRYAWGFSEAQWTSVLLASGIALAEAWRPKPFAWWHAAAAVGLVLTMTGVSIVRRIRVTRTDRLLHPRHLREVAELVVRLRLPEPSTHDGVRIATTSLGIQISAGRQEEPESTVHHYAISSPGETLSDRSAAALGELIARLDPAPAKTGEFICSTRGVFHLLIRVPLREVATDASGGLQPASHAKLTA